MEYITYQAAWLFVALFIKHFIVEGPLQFNWVFAGKGKFMAPGGLVHVGEHGLASLIVLVAANFMMPLSLSLIVGVVIAEVILHYAIDYTKAQVSRRWYEFNVETSKMTVNNRMFWIALIADQCLHYLTYVGMVYLLVR